MTDLASPKAVNFRLFVFILAMGFWIYQFFYSDLSLFGWHFRFLTQWGLTANVIISWLMLRYALGKSEYTWRPLVSAGTVLNIMVLFLYWKLWFTDPALIIGNKPLPWYQEYYMHGLGPVLMLIDAFFILGAFRRLGLSFLLSIGIFLVYIGWTEFLVAPNNDTPLGKVLSGLPYPFLNDMDTTERIEFYGGTLGTATVFFLIGFYLSHIIARLQGRTVSKRI